MNCCRTILLCLCFLAPTFALGDEKQAPADDSTKLCSDIMALFQARCVKCHGTDKPKGRLDLTSMVGLSRGSRSGAVVHPGKLKDSLMWRLVQENQMPPKEPLSGIDRLKLRRWIEQGAPGLDSTLLVHYAFQPPVRPPASEVRQLERVRTNIDRFILAALEKKGMTLNREADRATLIRRVAFDLTGLPPTLAEIDFFLKDPSPAAYERMLEHYLASPHYGERWAKYWLDAAGYADSNGYFDADTDRPLAFRYRDYVIRSFNQDKPYNRFVQEQLAGDELAGFTPNGDVTSAMAELLTATHFLRNAPDGTGESDGNLDEVRTDRFTVLEGTLQITMSSLLGLTIQCARCHAHKFEPITHEEYYRLQAIFFPAYCPERWIVPKDRVVAIAGSAQRAEHKRKTEQIEKQIKGLQAGLTSAAEPLREQLIEERLQPLEVSLRDAVLKAVQTPKEKRTAEQQDLFKKHVEPLKITNDDLTRRFPEFAGLQDHVNKAVAAREKERPAPLEEIAVLVETDPNPPAHHVLVLGQHNAPGMEVQPGVPACLCTPANQYQTAPRPKDRVTSGRRTEFARWVTAPENPLFARVMVNRIWLNHFGTGIVPTPDNLGQSGAPPSHPELLDFLATEFIRAGWSIKAMHRQIMLSAVYRQASTIATISQEKGEAADRENRLLWHFPLRRLDAEALRDAMLTVSGELNFHMGGLYVPTHRAGGCVDVDEKHPGSRRRSVYLQHRRTQIPTFLELFDAPPLTPNCGRRNTATVPVKSLALLNSDFARARAKAFAVRLDREAESDADAKIVHAFRLATAREPNAAQMGAARRFLAAQARIYPVDEQNPAPAWIDFCQMILAGNAFLYVE